MAVNGTALAPPTATWDYVEFRRAIFHWVAVKTWELHREFDLEDEGSRVYGANAETRSWLGGGRVPFDLAPHIIGRDDRFGFLAQPEGRFFSTAWYQAQVTVNSGNVRDSKPISPVDWNYQPDFVNVSGAEFGFPTPVRMLLTFTKLYQLTYDYDTNINPAAFSVAWGQQHPARWVTRYPQTWSEADQATLGALYDATLSAFMDKVERIPVADWPRREDTDRDGRWCDEDKTLLKPPTWNGDAPGECATDWDYDGSLPGHVGQTDRQAEYWWHMIRLFRNAGVSEATLNRATDWGEAMWPLGDWEALRAEAGPVEYHLPLESGWNTLALPITPENTDMAQVVGSVAGLVMVKDASGRAFLPEYDFQEISVWDPTKAYKVLVNGEATLTVTGSPLEPAETPIHLEAGWNLLPYFLETPRPVEEALAPILTDVQYLMDDADGVYDPSTETNTIGSLEPSRGYLIHLARATTLIYPSD